VHKIPEVFSLNEYTLRAAIINWTVSINQEETSGDTPFELSTNYALNGDIFTNKP